MAELLTAFVRHRHFRRAAAGKAESVRNISIFSGLTCKKPRPGQTDGRQEINRSGEPGAMMKGKRIRAKDKGLVGVEVVFMSFNG